jgi:hypothetical protein
MRCLRIAAYRHLDDTATLALVVPCGTKRTKRRTMKKWIRRSVEFAAKQPEVQLDWNKIRERLAAADTRKGGAR